MGENVTTQIRVMNPFRTDAEIKQDSVIGEANDFACLTESMQDIDNLNSVRRIGGDGLEAELGTFSGEKDVPIPDHLVDDDDTGLTHLPEHNMRAAGSTANGSSETPDPVPTIPQKPAGIG